MIKRSSILYFEFNKDTDTGKGFIEGLLLGEKKPNKAHPKSVITKEKVMIILSLPFKSCIEKKIISITIGKEKQFQIPYKKILVFFLNKGSRGFSAYGFPQ